MSEGMSAEVPTERHHCMISTCDWYYETAARMTYGEAQHAIEVGDLHGVKAGRDRLLLIDTAVRVHLETHSLLEWATEVHQERKRADAAMAELAAKVGEADQLRARLDVIGETQQEWRAEQPSGAWNMSHTTPTEDTARRVIEITREMGHAIKLERRVVGEWREVPDA